MYKTGINVGVVVLAGTMMSIVNVSVAQAATAAASIHGGFVAFGRPGPSGTGTDLEPFDDHRISNFGFSFDSIAQASGSIDAEGVGFTAKGSYAASANALTGGLKVSSSITANAFAFPTGYDVIEVVFGFDFDGVSYINNRLLAEVSEVFTITGTGPAKYNLLLDASWDGAIYIAARVTAISLSTGERIRSAKIFEVEGVAYDDDTNDFVPEIVGPKGSLSKHSLPLEVDFAGAVGEKYQVTWSLIGYSSAFGSCEALVCSAPGKSILDASRTAHIFYSGSAGLNVVPSSADFLKDSEFQTYRPNSPAPIPLPASAVLLISGIAGLSVMRKRNRGSA